MINKKFFALFLTVVFLAVGVIADFEYNGNSIIKKYSEGDIITGKVNLSFDEQEADSMITSNFKGNMSLIELLRANDFVEGEDYECSITGCEADFSSTGEISELVLDGEGISGLLITGNNIDRINSVKFTIDSTKGASCFGQLFVDILNDGEKRVINTAHTDTKCGVRAYGCFDSNSQLEEATLTTNPYCEKVTLPAGPAYSAGAKIRNSTAGSGNIKIDLYNGDWEFLKGCTLPKHTQQVQELECNLEYSSAETKEYYLCVRAEGAGNYKINTETSNSCGCAGIGCLAGTTDFEIFAQPLQFDDVNFVIDDSSFQNSNGIALKDYIYDYILDRYLGDCEGGCVIPIKYSGGGQTLSFSNVLVEYFADDILKSSNKMHGIVEEKATLTSDSLLVGLEDAGFTIPENTNEKNFKLYIQGEQAFSQPINISKSLTFDVNPRFVSIGIDTTFEATGFTGNVTSKWAFGDEREAISNNNKATHRYTEEGQFDMEVTLKKAGNVTSTRTFRIIVGNAEEAANQTIKEYRDRIDKIKNALDGYSPWIRNVIEEEIDPDAIESELDILERRYNDAENDENFTAIMLDLIDLKVPKSINTSRSGQFPLVIGFENFDVSYIEELSSEDGDDEEIRGAIAGWMNENVDGNIKYEEISAFYDSEAEVIVSKFELDVTPKSEESYLIIGYSLAGVTFDSNYNEKSLEGGTYIPLSDVRRRVAFVIADEISPAELGLYVSPLIGNLGYDAGEIREAEKRGFNWGFFTIGMVVLLIFAFVVYIVMQEWYKRNYEAALFKSDEDLYNLINFIYNARRTGLNDGQIKLKLKQSKWSAEQIKYATKKLEGKRTGMFEIPLFRFAERKKVREEIMKRQENPGRNIY